IDWARVAPPATSANRSPTSLPSHSGGRASNPAGTTTITCPTSGWDVNGRNARSSIGTPRMGRNCFGSPGPARTPAPAATTTTPTSGGEAPGELTDSLQPDHFQLFAPLRSVRQEHAAKALARGLGKTPLDAGDGTDLAAQTNLAEEQRIRGDRSVVDGGDKGGQDGKICRRLDQPNAARHVHEDVQIAERESATALEH